MKPRCWKAADGKDRAAWLAARQKVVTASEAGSVTGSNPFKSAKRLWADKKLGDSFEGNEHTRRGQKYEGVVIEAWARANKAPYRRLTDLLVSTQHPFLGATLDGLARLNGQSIVVEVKCPAKPWGKKGLPKYYLTQVMVQMIVSSIPRAVVLEGQGPDYTSFVEHFVNLDDYSQEDVRNMLDKLQSFHAKLEHDIFIPDP